MLARTSALRACFRSTLRTSPIIRAPTAAYMARSYSSINAVTSGSAVTAYASTAPTVKYTEDHEWVALHQDGIAFVGITKYASDALGDVTFIEHPVAGDEVEKGDSIGSVESVKSASEIYAPVKCKVVETNKDMEDNTSLISTDPQGDGWFAKIEVSDPSEIEELMTLEAYEDFITELH